MVPSDAELGKANREVV